MFIQYLFLVGPINFCHLRLRVLMFIGELKFKGIAGISTIV